MRVYCFGKPGDNSFFIPAENRPNALQRFLLRVLLNIYYKEEEQCVKKAIKAFVEGRKTPPLRKVRLSHVESMNKKHIKEREEKK